MTWSEQTALFDESAADVSSGCPWLPGETVKMPIPSWMPPPVVNAVRRRQSADGYPVTFSRAEKKILRKRRKIRVSEWAEKNRVLTMSAVPGRWRNEVTPYSVGIMDAIAFPSVRVASIAKCPQSGLSEAVHNYVGSVIDQDPGPVLYTFPDKDMAEENSRDRILPMIKSSRRLRSYLTGTRNDESLMRINMAHMPIYLAWASSPSRLGNKPIKIAVDDEVDKYQARGSKETSAINLIDKRLTTYRQVSKHIKISTPTIETGNIWVAVNTEAEVVFHFWARCPECGRHQLMRFSQINFLLHCRDPKEMLRKNLARYECEHCSAHWDDHVRNQAVALGEWRSQGPDDDRGLELFAYLNAHRPQNIGFHLPAWIPRFNTLAYCAAAFLETLSGSPADRLDKKKNFANQIEARPYKNIIMNPVETEYRTAICQLRQQIVPAAAVALTAGIDHQRYGFYFLVRAWASDYVSWMIHYGKLATWDDIERLLFSTWYPVEGVGRQMAISRAAIDTGGSKFNPNLSMTEEAYWWIRKNGVGRGCRVWGIKGASWPQANRIKMSKPMDKSPSGRPIPGGLQILGLDTNKFKDAFFYRLQQAVNGEPEMCAWLHADTGDDYFAHITAEQKIEDEKGFQSYQKKGSRRNDWLDCEMMCAAAADPEWPEGGIHLVAPPVDPDAAARAENRAQNDIRQRPGWFANRTTGR